jgi:regulatory protein
MTDPADGRPGRRRTPSIAERRERRAAETDPAIVLAAAVRFLEARQRSATEVRRRLRSAGYQVALIEDAIVRLTELGFIDDAAFARAWVESRDRARPRGERALRAELGQKGVARDVTDAAIEDRRGEATARAEEDAIDGETAASVDEVAAERLLQRRAAQLGRVPDPRVRRQRAYALLARNGFDPGVCSTVARRFAEDVAEADVAAGLDGVDGDAEADGA